MNFCIRWLVSYFVPLAGKARLYIVQLSRVMQAFDHYPESSFVSGLIGVVQCSEPSLILRHYSNVVVFSGYT